MELKADLTAVEYSATKAKTETDSEILRSAFRQTGKLAPYVMPTGFEWANNYISLLTDGEKFVVVDGGAKTMKHSGGTTYYVHTKNGTSGNNGLSRTSPKKTVQQAVALASNGDTIIILDDGSYCITSENGIPSSPCQKSINI